MLRSWIHSLAESVKLGAKRSAEVGCGSEARIGSRRKSKRQQEIWTTQKEAP
jgi:hypothetical protein